MNNTQEPTSYFWSPYTKGFSTKVYQLIRRQWISFNS